MIPANAGNLKIGKGALVLADWTDINTPPAVGFDGIPVGNAQSITFDPGDIQKIEQYSSTEASSPLLLSQVTRQNPSLLVQCDEHTYQNLARYFLGGQSSSIQGAVGSTPLVLDNVKKGGVYSLGKYNTSIVSVIADGTEALLVNVDYRHYGERGRIEFIDGGFVQDDMDVTVTYTATARTIEKIAGATNLNKYVRATIFSDDVNQDGRTAKGVATFYKLAIAPEGAYPFVSDQLSQYSLRLAMLKDSAQTELFKVEYNRAS